MSDPAAPGASPQRRSWIGSWPMALPLLAFAALAAIFWFRLGTGDPSRIPSALIGRPAPQTALPPLAGLVNNGAQVPGLDPAVFKGKVSVVNVWASWCVPCHDEAPLLTELARDERLQIVGINYKDAPDNARRFLGRYGNPFGIVGVDGRLWRARDFCGRPRRHDRLQDGRPGHPGKFRHRAQGRDRQGAEGGELTPRRHSGMRLLAQARNDDCCK